MAQWHSRVRESRTLRSPTPPPPRALPPPSPRPPPPPVNENGKGIRVGNTPRALLLFWAISVIFACSTYWNDLLIPKGKFSNFLHLNAPKHNN